MRSGSLARVPISNSVFQLLPPRRAADVDETCLGRAARLVRSFHVRCLFAAVVIAECAFVYYTTDYEASHIGQGRSELIEILLLIFLALYSVEFVLKVGTFLYEVNHFCRRCDDECMSQLWGILGDMALLICSTLDYLAYRSPDMNVTYIQALRIAKVLKLFRITHVATVLPRLYLMFSSILNTLSSLVWSIALIAITLYVSSVLFVQGATSALERGTLDPAERADVVSTFGSVGEGMLNLYIMTLDGGYMSTIYGIVSKLGWVYSAIFLLFTIFMQISLVNIITSLFVESVMKHVEDDRETKIAQYLRLHTHEASKLKKLYQAMDPHGSGQITIEDLDHYSQTMDGSRDWAALGIEVQDAKDFFTILTRSTGSRTVKVKEFVTGCMKLKGPASSLDMQMLLFILDDMRNQSMKQRREFKELQKDLLERQPGPGGGAAGAGAGQRPRRGPPGDAATGGTVSI